MNNSRHVGATAASSACVAGTLIAVDNHPAVLVPLFLVAATVALIALTAALARNRARRQAAYKVLRLMLHTFAGRSGADKLD